MSHVSRLHLPYISPASPLHLQALRSLNGAVLTPATEPTQPPYARHTECAGEACTGLLRAAHASLLDALVSLLDEKQRQRRRRWQSGDDDDDAAAGAAQGAPSRRVREERALRLSALRLLHAPLSHAPLGGGPGLGDERHERGESDERVLRLLAAHAQGGGALVSQAEARCHRLLASSLVAQCLRPVHAARAGPLEAGAAEP